MKKYRLEIRGWGMDAIGHSITEEHVQPIKDLIGENKENTFELSDYFMDNIRDMYDGDIFRNDRPFWYDEKTYFFLYDGETDVYGDGVKPLKDWLLKDCTDHYEVDEDYDGTNIPCWPGVSKVSEWSKKYADPPYEYDVADYIVLYIEENKGGMFYFEFESDEEPNSGDFSVVAGSIETPDGDWDFCDKFFFKGQELEIVDHLDSTGKGSSAYLYCKDSI